MAPKNQFLFIITSLIVKNIPTPFLTFTGMLRSPCLDQGHGSVSPQLAKIRTPPQVPDSPILLATALEASLRSPENSWREWYRTTWLYPITCTKPFIPCSTGGLSHTLPFVHSQQEGLLTGATRNLDPCVGVTGSLHQASSPS